MPNVTTVHPFYVGQSMFTDPGPWAERLDAVPADLRAMRDAVRPLVFHYRADGDWAEHGIAPERITEIDTRYASRMLARLLQLHDAPLGTPRPPRQRLVGCCRDFAVLLVALARHKGIPARMRVGFATYFMKEWNLDHVVAEVWDAAERRWRLVDAELWDDPVDPTDGAPLDPLDLPRDRFIAGPQAWLACRAGEADPERFLVAPDLDIPGTRSWPYLLHNLVHDLAALNKHEMLLWEDWGLTDGWDRLTETDLAMLDETSRAMVDPEVTQAELWRLFDRDGFRVPAVVTSYSPALAEVPAEVRLEPEAAPSPP